MGVKDVFFKGWRDGLVVKSIDCSSRGPGFSAQHPEVSSQWAVTPVAGDLLPSSGMCGYCVHRFSARQPKRLYALHNDLALKAEYVFRTNYMLFCLIIVVDLYTAAPLLFPDSGAVGTCQLL